MSIGNSLYHHSVIEDRIEKLMDKPEYWATNTAYTTDLADAVFEMLKTDFPYVEWQSFTTPFPHDDNYNCEEGIVSLSWIENGHLHMIGWDYFYV